MSLSDKINYTGEGDCVFGMVHTDDVREAVKELKIDIFEGVKMVIKMYPHKSGEELAMEISSYLNEKVIYRRFGEDLT